MEQETPHLIAFQEVLPHQRSGLERVFPHYNWFGVGRNSDFSGEQCPVGVLSDVEVLEHDTVWLSEQPDRPGSVGWDACLPRICTFARVLLEQSELVFASTHFDHLGHQARMMSASLLNQRFANDISIIAGDFNCEPESEPIRTLCTHFGSAMTQSESNCRTFHDFGCPNTDLQIDDILFDKRFRLHTFQVLADEGPVFLSDHSALLASLSIQ